MEDLAQEFYQSGSPNSNEIKTEIIQGDKYYGSKDNGWMNKSLSYIPGTS
jgi:hypothetical protein